MNAPMIYELRCMRVNENRHLNVSTGEVEPTFQSRAYLDNEMNGDVYQLWEGQFYPAIFELGKKYRITIEEIL